MLKEPAYEELEKRVITLEEQYGEPIHILGSHDDDTERKISEKALRKSEDFMCSIFQAAPIGIGVVQNRIISQVNDRFCEMLGYSQDELVGQEARMVYPDDEEYKRVGKEKYRQISLSGTGTIETGFRCKDGRKIDVLLSSTPIEINNLDAGVTFTALDITSYKNIQTALQRSKTKYRTMMETLKSPVYICSQEYRIQYMNPAMVDRVGYNATGALCYEAIHGFQKRCQWCDCEQTFERGHSEKDIVSPKDNRSFNISCTVFKNEDGSMSMLSVCRDTTEFIALQNRLQQAQKLESIGTLASGIAHDFNNILFPIIGMSDLLMDDLPPGSLAYEHANEINKAGLRAKEMVYQILSFSRKSEQVMMPVKFQLILKEVLKLCRSTIPINIEIEQKIQRDCGSVMANPTQLHQIGMNLITNAYQAVQDKNGRVIVVLEEVDLDHHNLRNVVKHSGRYALLTVSDNGIGMTEEVKKKVFDPYFTTKERGKGVGLGLAVVYGIVKEYGGEIEIETKIGSGTSFKIYLPLINRSKNKHTDDIKTILETGHEHILLVDDEHAVAKLQQEILERLGYKVTRKMSSVEALKDFKLSPHSFDIILTDMSMPNMTGEQLTYEIRQVRPEIPVIICTGFSERLNEEQSLKIGIDGFLMKPIVKSEMAKMVRNVLDKSKQKIEVP